MNSPKDKLENALAVLAAGDGPLKVVAQNALDGGSVLPVIDAIAEELTTIAKDIRAKGGDDVPFIAGMLDIVENAAVEMQALGPKLAASAEHTLKSA